MRYPRGVKQRSIPFPEAELCLCPRSSAAGRAVSPAGSEGSPAMHCFKPFPALQNCPHRVSDTVLAGTVPSEQHRITDTSFPSCFLPGPEIQLLAIPPPPPIGLNLLQARFNLKALTFLQGTRPKFYSHLHWFMHFTCGSAPHQLWTFPGQQPACHPISQTGCSALLSIN